MTRRLRNVLILIGLAIPAVAVAASHTSSGASCCPSGACCQGGGCPLCPSHAR